MGRRLSDLYVVGKEVAFNDGSGGDPITVWIQKLNDNEHDKAMRKAQSARAKTLASRKVQDSEGYQSVLSDAQQYSTEEKVIFLALDEVEERAQSLEAEVAEEGEWNKDDYLQGLREAWVDSPDGEQGLSSVFTEDPEDDEAKRVYDELVRFQGEVQKKNLEALAESEGRFRALDGDKLEELVAYKLLKIEGNRAWIKEFQRCQIWLAVREPEDHNKAYFEREEVDVLQRKLIDRILEEYSSLEVDPIEGKDSEEAQPSSDSSETPKETSKPSGRKVAPRSKKSQPISIEPSATLN